MCGGNRFHFSKKLECWSALNRSSRVGEGERYVGWAKEASGSSHGGTVSSRRWWTKGSRHCGGGRSWFASVKGAETGPGTVNCCARASQGSGVEAGVSDSMTSRDTRSSRPEEVPSKAPGSRSATPANGKTGGHFPRYVLPWKTYQRRAACQRGSSRHGPWHRYCELDRP